jgi:hypothetical protein
MGLGSLGPPASGPIFANDFLQALLGKVRYARCVVERLRDHLAVEKSRLEFDDDVLSVRINSKQIQLRKA